MSFAAAKGQKGMIFLELHHPIVRDTLLEKLKSGGELDAFDVTCSDFDDVRYRMLVKNDDKNVIHFQLAMPFLKKVMEHGASSVIDGMYGAYKSSSTELGYDICFKIDASRLKESPETVAKNFSEIKRNLLAAPLRDCFQALAAGKSSSKKPLTVPVRSSENMTLLPGSDRVMVYFNIAFMDETDSAIARVFLQEFTESQRKVPLAPAVTFTTDMPMDLAKVVPRGRAKSVGYVQFQMFQSHVDGARMDTAIDMFTMFRSYLHYHIKASKAHLHARMRARVSSLLQVLKRAEPGKADPKGSKKAFRTY